MSLAGWAGAVLCAYRSAMGVHVQERGEEGMVRGTVPQIAMQRPTDSNTVQKFSPLNFGTVSFPNRIVCCYCFALRQLWRRWMPFRYKRTTLP